MNKFKLVLLIWSFVLMIATLFFWTLFLPPLSELEGENALAQMVVFVPSIIAYPILFPIIWPLEIFYLFTTKHWSYMYLLFLLLSLITPILLLVIHFIIATPHTFPTSLHLFKYIDRVNDTDLLYKFKKMRLSISK